MGADESPLGAVNQPLQLFHTPCLKAQLCLMGQNTPGGYDRLQ